MILVNQISKVRPFSLHHFNRTDFMSLELVRPNWKTVKSDLFDESLNRMMVTFPDLSDKLSKFIVTKSRDPLNIKYGKHDRRMIGDLAGFYHAHLRDDAVLIYTLAKQVMTLVLITPHAEIEGKRLKCMARRLQQIAA